MSILARARPLLLAVVLAACASADGAASRDDVARWERRARDVTIIRDDWGIPHVYGKTDADAVFGVVYAQAEDDFNRIEVNYLNAMGRLAEAEGESEIYRDLRMKLFIDPDSMKARYAASPEWLRALMDAYADGLNYYLHTHPEVKPRVITRFEPWMALTFSEGSIGGDIEQVSLRGLEELYGAAPAASRLAPAPVPAAADSAALMKEPSGSNGFAIAPSRTADGDALLLINPHTSFFFRAEAQMVSEEGLNAYGALTWGQFFIYQGFNDRVGWMHTSSGVDNIDEYLETVTDKDGRPVYRYGDEERPVTAQRITVPFRTDSGMARREFTVYRTHHGPVVREQDGKWVSVKLMQAPVEALTQSYTRTKARSLDEFRKAMELHTNSSNNTLYADADGNIAYFHSNFVPRRDPSFDWSRPVDGSDPATEWQGIHTVDESPNVINPPNGWVQNTNNWPYSAAGANSPKERDYPSYFDRAGENPRGIHAMRVLERDSAFTLASLIAAAYDPELPAFEKLIPALVRNYDALPATSPLRRKLAAQVDSLRGWDMRWSASSVPTALAIFFGDDLMERVRRDAAAAGVNVYDYMDGRATAAQRLASLEAASDRLAADFGRWETPWGEINRFQRLTGDIVQPFDDAKPSIPVPFTSARWGSLASFGARPYPQTKRWYGTSGNSFVAVVQFGDSVRARAVSAGGESGDPASPHFDDQADRYARGDLRDVYFYRSQLAGHTEREYHPGQR
ncbi:MAG TPA: acylase [Gemmatimonadaceae bacterium]|nr:acylase [Gemmatimonadaceae bacterium]